MKRWKKPAAWLTATVLALGLATLGNLSYAADESPEVKETLQTASSTEAETTAEKLKPSSAEEQTETPAAETADPEQTAASSESKSAENSESDTSAAVNTAKSQVSTAAASNKTKKITKSASSDAEILIEGSTLYAQGTSMVIKKDSDGKAYAFDSSGNSRLSDIPVTSSFTIYGGGKNKPAKGNVMIDIQNVQVSRIYGGGFSDGTGSADLSGNVTIKVSGSVNVSSVYGGGYASASKGNASADVSGSVTVDISAVPSSNHGNLYGGGYATSTGSYNATADTGSVSIGVTSRTYSLHGGGYATSTGDGEASADVAGSVSCTLKSVDIREVYAGGYADGSHAHAKSGSVTSSFTGQNNEVMIIQGAGNANKGGCADVSGNVTVNLVNCSNIYGYVIAAGTASSGGSANVNGSVSLNVTDSVSPVAEQWGNPVAAGFNGGGKSSGEGSHADVTGICSTLFKDSEIVGTIVGGGESSGGGSAKTAKTSLTLDNVKGSEYKGTMYYGDYIAGGEVDDASSKDLAESVQSTLTVSKSNAEFLWGGLLLKGQSLSSGSDSELKLNGNESTFAEIAHFDTLSITHPLILTSFVPKSNTVPTMLKTSGLAIGDTAVTYQGSEADDHWFSLKNGKLKYKHNADSASWSIATFGTASGSIAVEQPSKVPGILVENNDADCFLTEDDRQLIANGSTVEIVLKSDAVSAPSDEIQELLNKEIKRTQSEPAVTFDINLLKVIDGMPEKIPTSSSPLRLTFDIPSEYQKEGRQFQIIRIHQNDDGSFDTAVLNNLGTDSEKITIETDRFSIYSLIYKDAQAPDASTSASASSSEVSTVSTSAHSITNTSKSRQSAIKKRSVAKKNSSKKTHSSDSQGQNSGSFSETATTADTHRDISSLLLILSGSLICTGFLRRNRAEQ